MFSPLSREQADNRLHGVIAPVVTTFGADGEVDLSSFVANITGHMQNGLAGVLVAGSTGEAALLDEDERSRLLDAARSAVPAGGVLLAGVGGESTRLTIRRCIDAAARNADGVLVVSPHYYTASMDREALRRHFLAVADSSPVPVLLYNIPKYTHFALMPDLVSELARHENIVGMKDSSGNMEMFPEYVLVQKNSAVFTVLTGHGPSFTTALEIGARGAILAASLFTREVTPGIYRAWQAGDVERAALLHNLQGELGALIVGGLGIPGVKAALDKIGMVGGPVRSPLVDLDSQRRVIVATKMEELARAMTPATA